MAKIKDQETVYDEPSSNTVHSIVNHSCPKDNQIGILQQRATYIQQPDTNSDPEGYQTLTLGTSPVGFSIEENTDSFIRISIGEEGGMGFWSVGGLEDLVTIFNDFERRRGSTIRYRVTKEVVSPDGTVHSTTFE